MHSHEPRQIFRNPPALSHDVVAETLERAIKDRSHEGEAADTLVGSALHDDDREFVEHWCMQVGTRASSGSPLLGLAGLCLGHTARRFGYLSDEGLALLYSLAARAEADPDDVDTRAIYGLDDATIFLRLKQPGLGRRRQSPGVRPVCRSGVMAGILRFLSHACMSRRYGSSSR